MKTPPRLLALTGLSLALPRLLALACLSLALPAAGCWRPLVLVHQARAQGEAWQRGEPTPAYAKRRTPPLRAEGGPVRVAAHRGFSTAAPENTLASFRAAVAAGADALEFDVRLTKDGQPVIMHDARVDRTTDGHGEVSALTLAELRRLDAGSRFSPRFAGERVPTLDEVLAIAEASGLGVLAELKDPDLRRLPGLLAAGLTRHHLRERALVISFHPRSLRRFHRLAPEVALGRLAYPYDPPRRRAAQVRADAALAFFGALDRRAVAEAHAAGLQVFAWTVDDPAMMARLVRWGVDGLITDDVAAARRVVAAARAAGGR